MIAAFLLSLRQLGDPRVLRVLVKSLVVTLAAMATLGVALWFAARALARWIGAAAGTADLAGALAVLVGVAFGWLLFRIIAIAVIGLFADEVVNAVEARHYPAALASARRVPLARGVAMGLRSAGRALIVNVAASPLYLMLLVTGVGTAIGFFAINAWLLGRDLADMVAARHMDARAMAAFRSDTVVRRWTLGAVATALMLVPFVNLIAPVLGAAMATHVFHRRLEV
ncbi:EI24 domain-containing protein [Sphingomonas sp.]|uniref:EI24 domain-containing protein n=1 Tax=Sphingomonas sp. TaxID=28214 RepID=UPI002C7F23BB|nr:EI24 domain-containing protein [Sphingomonas sp.]HWK35552.1 EI24 domain-containing protein [Sphingomonas sp.]